MAHYRPPKPTREEAADLVNQYRTTLIERAHYQGTRRRGAHQRGHLLVDGLKLRDAVLAGALQLEAGAHEHLNAVLTGRWDHDKLPDAMAALQRRRGQVDEHLARLEPAAPAA